MNCRIFRKPMYTASVVQAGQEQRIAISFCDNEEKAYLRDIQKLINKTIPVIAEHPYVMTNNSRPVQQPAQRPSNQKRYQGNRNDSRGNQRNYRPSYAGRS